MLQNMAWQAADRLARNQLAMFQALADQINLTPDDRHLALNLDDRAWTAWMDFLWDGPLPADPPLPDMLRRVGQAAFNLLAVAGQIGGR